MDDDYSPVILDCGAYTAKIGLATSEEPSVIPNCIMRAKTDVNRSYIADQIDECRDPTGLYYSLCYERGYLLNFDVQKQVWDHMFTEESAGFTIKDRDIIITEPHFNFKRCREGLIEILYEEYKCAGIFRCTAADLAGFNYAVDGVTVKLNFIVIDIGHSFTHIVPFVGRAKWEKAIRRVDVGGKVLTNRLQEIISCRYLNVMEETYVINQLKEDVCFVSLDIKEDLRSYNDDTKKNKMIVEYVLPNFRNMRRGFIFKRSDHDAEKKKLYKENHVLRLWNERFTVPEALFVPSDIGINQVGIAEAVIDALKDCPEGTHGELLGQIILVGGSALLPGLKERLHKDLTALAAQNLEVCIEIAEDPITFAWWGGHGLANNDCLGDLMYSRDDYEEYGLEAAAEKQILWTDVHAL